MMEYVQERVATLHAFGDRIPPAPTDRAAVVVPLTGDDHGSQATERVLSQLETVDPKTVIVALRADPGDLGHIARWLDSFDLSLELLWCNAPQVDETLADAGIDAPRGKGRDVWLALGIAAREPYVVVHDGDVQSYSRATVPRLLAPLTFDYEFVKGYYARVEDNRLFGRLFRLCYVPLVRALGRENPAPVVEYLAAFRYALAGEFAATADVVSKLRPAPDWGFEVGLLGDAFDIAGFEGTAQVDLGVHKHDHRSVDGSAGLCQMATEVVAEFLRVVEAHGIEPGYEHLRGSYLDVAEELVDQYAADAAFNGLEYDRRDELEQVERYAETIEAPPARERLPRWQDVTLDPAVLLARSRAGRQQVTES